MVDFKKVREDGKKLKLTIEIDFENCIRNEEEASDAIQFLIDKGSAKEISDFIVFLIRTMGASTWELVKTEVKEIT